MPNEQLRKSQGANRNKRPENSSSNKAHADCQANTHDFKQLTRFRSPGMARFGRLCLLSGTRFGNSRVLNFSVLKNASIRIAAVFATIFGISLLHYTVPTSHYWVHTVLHEAYYIPLILMNIWYGWRGGFLAWIVTAILYIPHIVMAWSDHSQYTAVQWVELAMFLLIPALTGVLAEHERVQRLTAEHMAKKFEDANAELQGTNAELQRTNAELQRSFELLRRADRLSAMGELSAGLAHEIRNPLGSIDGAVQILLRDALEPEIKQEFGELAQRELDRLKGILNRFLNYARPQPPLRIETDPIMLLDSVAKLAEETAKISGVKIEIKADLPVPMIAIDPEQIKQVLLNLIINAIQAMPSGGRIELQPSVRKACLHLEVRDEGVGIDPADVEHIFNPFFTTRESGTGLGLSIAERMINQHGGRIEVRRNSGRGMTFTVVLPLADC